VLSLLVLKKIVLQKEIGRRCKTELFARFCESALPAVYLMNGLLVVCFTECTLDMLQNRYSMAPTEVNDMRPRTLIDVAFIT
jgi:hypothetical protein